MDSIILAAHNSEDTFPETIKSIEAQTSQDFEVVFIDDGSTDKTLGMMRNYRGRKLILRNKKKMGLPYSLNRGIRASKGRYIFRMDADDIMLPERVQKQAAFLDEHPEIGVLSSPAICIGRDGKETGLTGKGMNAKEVRCAMLFGNPLVHASVAMRRKFAMELYTEKYTYSQDYELWSRLIKKTDFFIMKEPLIRYRIVEASLEKKKKKFFYAKMALKKNIENYAKTDETDLNAALALSGWKDGSSLREVMRYQSKLFSAKGLDKLALLRFCTVKTLALIKRRIGRKLM